MYNAAYIHPVRYNRAAKSPAVKSRALSLSLEKKKKNKQTKERERGERTIRRIKNTPPRGPWRHVPTAVAMRLPNGTNVRAAGYMQTRARRRRAPGCPIHAELPVIWSRRSLPQYFAAAAEAHFLFFPFAFFFLAFYLSLSLPRNPRRRGRG